MPRKRTGYTKFERDKYGRKVVFIVSGGITFPLYGSIRRSMSTMRARQFESMAIPPTDPFPDPRPKTKPKPSPKPKELRDVDVYDVPKQQKKR